jgi:hypothetical protein
MTAGHDNDGAEATPEGSSGDGLSGDTQPTDARGRDLAVEIARDLLLDLRAELPRLDARAAAGAALAGAILIGVVSVGTLPMPIYTFGVIAAALLTIALLAFLAVLLPDRNIGRLHVNYEMPPSDVDPASRSALDPRANAHRLAAALTSMDRVEYFTSVLIQMSTQVRRKNSVLTFAFASGLLAIATLAVGAATALAIGFR